MKRPGRSAVTTGGSVLAVFLAGCALVAIHRRNAGLYPVVLSDEYRYSMAARVLPVDRVEVPGYLFNALYRVTTSCGDRFLTCGRALDLAFFALTLALVYGVARLVLGRLASAAIMLCVAAGPLNVYSAYFMPESMYAFGFWALVRLCLVDDLSRSPPDGVGPRWRSWWLPASTGAVLGLLALVKPHALFLVPAVLVHRGVVDARVGSRHARAIASRALVLVATAGVAKFGLGAVLAGAAAFTMFGAYYGGIGEGAAATGGHGYRIVMGALWSLRGHAVSLVLLFALPVAALVSRVHVAGRRSVGESFDRPTRVALLAALLVPTLVVMSAAFTASVAGQGPYETLNRLHARYYDFALPLVVIAGCGCAFDARSNDRRMRGRLAVASALVASVVYATFGGLDAYAVGLVDNPVVAGVLAHASTRYGTALLAIASLALWVSAPRRAAVFFLAFVLPFVSIKGSSAIAEQLRERRFADAYERAGQHAKRVLSKADVDRLRVFGADPSGVFRALFQLDSADAVQEVVPPHGAVGPAQWPASEPWALIVGDHPLEDIDATLDRGDGFVLAHRVPAPR